MAILLRHLSLGKYKFMQLHNIVSTEQMRRHRYTFLTHRDCRNFRDGACMLFGVPVNLSGPACPRFLAKNAWSSLLPQQPVVTYYPPSSQVRETGKSESSFAGLKRRLDKAEDEIKQIRTMLKRSE